MPHVATLYRYSVKGLAPKKCEALCVLPGGRIDDGRVLAFRLASSSAAAVTPSPFAHVQALSRVMRLVSPGALQDLAVQQSLKQTGARLMSARADKEFHAQTCSAHKV